MGSVRRVKGMMGCVVKYGVKGVMGCGVGAGLRRVG